MKYLFKVNKEKWAALIKLRNWEYPITMLAKKTGFTKSYISQVINGGVAISVDFMLALVRVSGNDPARPSEWACLFEIVKDHVRKGPTTNNYAKMRGEKTCVRCTLMSTLRRRDRATSLERLRLPEPIPAIDFYDDATPKRCRVGYRYKK